VVVEEVVVSRCCTAAITPAPATRVVEARTARQTSAVPVSVLRSSR
jgi:hypothetical protein